MKLNTSVAPGAACTEKRPSVPEVLPVVVPFTSTVTPGSGLWSVPDVTMPLTVRVGAVASAGRYAGVQLSGAGIRPNVSSNSQ